MIWCKDSVGPRTTASPEAKRSPFTPRHLEANSEKEAEDKALRSTLSKRNGIILTVLLDI